MGKRYGLCRTSGVVCHHLEEPTSRLSARLSPDVEDPDAEVRRRFDEHLRYSLDGKVDIEVYSDQCGPRTNDDRKRMSFPLFSCLYRMTPGGAC